MFSILERIRKFASNVLPSFFGRTTFSISGNAGTKGVGIATVHLSSDGGFKATVNTNVNGDFEFINLSAGSYTITPALSGHFFTPASRLVTITDASVSGISFEDPPIYGRFGLSVSIQNWNRH
jgi:hypothetical protein